MSKRIVGIIIGAILLIGLVALLWLWYLGRQQQAQPGTPGNSSISSNVPSAPGQQQNGYASQVSVNSGSAPANNLAQSGNINLSGGKYSPATGAYTINGGAYNPTTGAYTAQNGTIYLGGTYNPTTGTYTFTGGTYNPTTGAYTGNSTYNPTVGTYTFAPYNPATSTPITYTPIVFVPTPVSPVGATWIPNTGSPFNPTAINGIDNSNPNGNGSLLFPMASINGSNSGGISPLAMMLAAAGIGFATCSARAAVTAATVAAAETAAVSTWLADVPLRVPVSVNLSVPVEGATTAAVKVNEQGTDIASCLTRAIAKVLVAQLTQSIVQWINSGFNGSPTFIQNRQQFFGNVADQAAGAFIQGSGLSFLCSPFKLQIRIALAQSYANRSAPTCSLTQVVGNVTSFMNGNFNAGGWPGLISFTSIPTNNPYGAFALAQVSLSNAVLNAQQRNAALISANGFLSLQRKICGVGDQDNITYSTNTGSVPCPDGCRCKTTTPGSVIEESLNTATNGSFEQLNLAQSFDQIFGALANQLLFQLQSGLTGLSQSDGGSGGLTQDQLQAQQQAQALLAQMGSATINAQQYAQLQQGDIADIQNAQSQLNTLGNCWDSATSTPFTAAQIAQAQTNAAAARTRLTALQGEVDAHNAQITQANAAIALLQQLQSAVLNATSLADLQGISARYTTAQTSGSVYGSADIVAAQQDRYTLQSRLSATNQDTSTKLAQCYAFANQTH